MLDTWTQPQLDMMILGGNAKAREALGETVLLCKDLKSKYTSHTSLLYKEKLQQRVLQKELPVPDTNLIQLDAPQQEQPSLIDFSQDAPNEDNFDIFKPMTTTVETSTRPSIFDELASTDETVSPNRTNAAVDNFFDQFEQPVTPKRTLKPRTHQRSKLGARKVQTKVFQQQTQLAMQEEKMREEGMDIESIGRNQRNELLKTDESIVIPILSTRLNYEEPNEERLGMMSLGHTKKKVEEKKEDEDTFARDKFGNAKAISSDQYFGRPEINLSKRPDGFSQKKKTPMSKKILQAASNKIQTMLADLE